MVFELITERLLLRELNVNDLDFVAEMLRHPEVMGYYPKLYSRAEAEEWTDRQIRRYERDGHGLWLVQENDNSRPVGQVGLCLQEVDNRLLPEIGYLIHRPFWRQGFALEAATAVRDHSMYELDKPEVYSLIRAENWPSQAIALKLGMHDTGEVLFHGVVHRLFSVSRDEAKRLTTP